MPTLWGPPSTRPLIHGMDTRGCSGAKVCSQAILAPTPLGCQWPGRVYRTVGHALQPCRFSKYLQIPPLHVRGELATSMRRPGTPFSENVQIPYIARPLSRRRIGRRRPLAEVRDCRKRSSTSPRKPTGREFRRRSCTARPVIDSRRSLRSSRTCSDGERQFGSLEAPVVSLGRLPIASNRESVRNNGPATPRS